MAYQLVENFAAGLDTRKSPLTSPAGTLTRLVNATITPGGEIAKRRAFVKLADLDSSTFGLCATESTLYAVGGAAPPAPPAIGVSGVTLKYLKLPSPYVSTNGIRQYDFDVFDGKIYMACYNPNASGGQQVNPHFWVYNVTDTFIETEGSNKGYYVRTFQSKVYSINGKTLYFSAVNDPRAWNSGTSLPPIPPATAIIGQGSINVSLVDADSERLTSLEVYYNQLAVFSTKAVQIWSVDPDPLQNSFDQLLRGAGTSGPRSPLQYGNGDVLYLDRSGIRSLKARDSSNSASVSDIGSPVDPTTQSILNINGQAYMDAAIALLEPSIGRFWMVFPTQILVLSYFPGPKITAWGQYTLPFTVQHAVTCGGRIFFRDTANGLWIYGGANNVTYDNCGVEIRLPYLDAKKPGHKKLFRAFDLTASGTWRVAVSYDFNNPDAEDTIGTFAPVEPATSTSAATWNAGASEMQGYDSHISLRFYNNDANPASISNCAIHYDMAEAED